MVLEGVGEDEEHVVEKVVDGFVTAALDVALDCSHIHWVGDHIEVVGILEEMTPHR